MKKYDYIYYYNPQDWHRFSKQGVNDWLGLVVIIVWATLILLFLVLVSVVSADLFISNIWR